LDKARAELELVNAEIGNVFIPGQIQAAKMQIAWNETILLTIKSLGGLGSGLNKLFGMSKLIQGTFGPFFSAYINIKAASIALLTQKQIMRSLTGQVLAKTSAESKGSAKNKINLTHENLLLAQIDAELEDIIFTNRKKAEEAKSSFVAVKHYLTVERTLTQQTNLAYEGVRGKLAKTNFELIKKNALNNIGNQLETKSMIIRDKLTGRIIGQQKENLAFGMRNMTQERYIAILNKMVAGPLPLTEIQMKKYGITLQNNNIIIAENTILTEEQIIRLKLYGMTLQTVTAGTEVATMASQRLSMAMMGIGSILMVGSMAFGMLGEKMKIFGDEANVMRISMVMMALTMGFLVMEIILTTASISALSAVLEVGLIKSFVIWGASVWAAAAGMGALAIATATFVAAARIAFLLTVAGAAIVALAYVIDKALPNVKDMTEGMVDMGIGAEDLNAQFKELTMNTDMMFADMGLDDYSMDLQNAQKDTQDFANAREELFFGFKAGAVTGDLIKQVQHTGIENFVANTEVIMTNNFTGLTSDEIAETVIRKIQQKGTKQGIVM